jgi:hypothetical protein
MLRNQKQCLSDSGAQLRRSRPETGCGTTEEEEGYITHLGDKRGTNHNTFYAPHRSSFSLFIQKTLETPLTDHINFISIHQLKAGVRKTITIQTKHEK